MSATFCRRPVDGVRGACDTFEQFHCFPPRQINKLPCARLIPKVLVHLGELRALVYRSDRGQRGHPRTFVHWMENPTSLACDSHGRQLYILGGNYRVTPRGIEG